MEITDWNMADLVTVRNGGSVNARAVICYHLLFYNYINVK